MAGSPFPAGSARAPWRYGAIALSKRGWRACSLGSVGWLRMLQSCFGSLTGERHWQAGMQRLIGHLPAAIIVSRSTLPEPWAFSRT